MIAVSVAAVSQSCHRDHALEVMMGARRCSGLVVGIQFKNLIDNAAQYAADIPNSPAQQLLVLLDGQAANEYANGDAWRRHVLCQLAQHLRTLQWRSCNRLVMVENVGYYCEFNNQLDAIAS